MKSRFFTLFALAFLLAPLAEARPHNNEVSMEGRVTSVSLDRDQYRVMLDTGSFRYYVPRSMVRRDLRIGDQVRIVGYANGNSVQASSVSLMGGGNRNDGNRNDDSYRGLPNGSRGMMRGTVTGTNRRLNYITIREDSTGRSVKIDVRHMDTRRSINVWQTRYGDHIRVNGGWENRDTFDASRVEY